MKNVRPEVSKFVSACEHLFSFTHESGNLTTDECQLLEFYVEELQRQIAPVCIDPHVHCDDHSPSST
jgi:hypothetical protein